MLDDAAAKRKRRRPKPRTRDITGNRELDEALEQLQSLMDRLRTQADRHRKGITLDPFVLRAMVRDFEVFILYAQRQGFPLSDEMPQTLAM